MDAGEELGADGDDHEGFQRDADDFLLLFVLDAQLSFNDGGQRNGYGEKRVGGRIGGSQLSVFQHRPVVDDQLLEDDIQDQVGGIDSAEGQDVMVDPADASPLPELFCTEEGKEGSDQ